MLAAIHEQLQFLARLAGGQYEDNPAPQPQRWPRPGEIHETALAILEKQGDDEAADVELAAFEAEMAARERESA